MGTSKKINNMEEKEILIHQTIENKIYFIRGQKVMIDRDLAELYGMKTRLLNQALRRNMDRFPSDFMFQLSEIEYNSLMSQIETSKKGKGGPRKLPYVFTEYGVLMLSSILNSERAIQVNIQIMRIFARIRQMFIDNTELRLEIEQIKKKINNHDKNIEIVFSYLDELAAKFDKPTKKKEKPINKIGFK